MPHLAALGGGAMKAAGKYTPSLARSAGEGGGGGRCRYLCPAGESLLRMLCVRTLSVLLALASSNAQAQGIPQRLSDWLIQNDATASRYQAGLSWQVPEEVPVQLSLKLELMHALAAPAGVGKTPAQNRILADFISRLPVTGRVPLSMVDARWLQAHPGRDPILLPGHKVVLPERPATVSVLNGAGLCRVAHVAGQEAGSYVSACAEPGAGPADWAWVAQPDGRVARYGIAAWNREPQDLPAPGAWIWAPPREAGWPEWFSEKLITFLSYQGAAPDRIGVTVATPVDTPALAIPGGAAEGFRWSSAVNGLIDPAPRPPANPEKSMQIPSALMQRERSRGLLVTASDWGSVGLLQTPSARMRDEGSFALHVSRVEPYTRLNVFFQPFQWMEAGFRYTNISNRLYGVATLSGDQTYKDKGFDIKFSLWDESAHMPALAVGFRDFAGTGLFSGEYLVASKRVGAVDASLGIGWGNLAGASRTPAPGSQGGDFTFKNYFSGTPRPFGGVQWTVPWAPLVLKAEYDGNHYRAEPLGNQLVQKSKFNVGMTYRLYKWLDVTAGVERGNTFNLGLTLHTDLSQLSTPKLNDAPRIPVSPLRPQTVPDWAKTARDLNVQTDWTVSQIKVDGAHVAVTVDDPSGTYWQDRVDRAASVLHRDAPADIDRFVLRYRARGLDLSEQIVDRQGWVASQVQPVPPSAPANTVLARQVTPAAAGAAQFSAQPALWDSNFRIGYAQSLGGPDNFVLYQIYAEQSARLRLGRPDTWLSGTVQLRLIDNYEQFRYTAPSNLPRVRTFLREYVTTSPITIPNLQATHVRKVSENQYVSAYAGYLEEMFAGFGGEWLYRPFASRLAFGVDANAVQQRDFHQNLSLRDPAYRVFTGHATAYWDTGWNDVEVRVSAGRYLARDFGGTVEMSKRFRNGVVFGAFATKTNVSAQQFGEGSFDKGIFLSIPYDAMFTRSSGSVANFEWKPLTRDGGAKLWRREQLYDVTRSRDLRTFEAKPAPPPNAELMPADHQPLWLPEPKAPAAYTAVLPQASAQQWTAVSDATFRLIEALDRQGFRNVAVEFDQAHRLNLKVAHDTLRPISRAVGRAARTALNLAPADAREIRIQFAERVEPLVEYEFFDLPRLRMHFAGELPVSALHDGVVVRYLNPGAKARDPLADLADVTRGPATPSLLDAVPRVYEPARVWDDFSAAATQSKKIDWLGVAGVGVAAVAGSSVLDSRGLRFAKDHARSGWLKSLNRVGDAIPWLGFAGAGLFALDTSDPRRSRTGYAAVEAGATTLVVATGLKYAVGRARPNSGLGPRDFEPFSGGSKRDAFPSRHSAVAWAVATPFALEYRAPWLYGVAALTNLSRVGRQEHWFSDTVAGSAIGYGLGRLFWESSRANTALPQVFVDPSSVNFSWTFY